MYKTKTLSFFSAVLLCFSLLPGCTGISETNTSSNASSNTGGAALDTASSVVSDTPTEPGLTDDSNNGFQTGIVKNFTLVTHWTNSYRNQFEEGTIVPENEYYDIAYGDVDYTTYFTENILNSNIDSTQPVYLDFIEINNYKPIFSLEFLDMLEDDSKTYEYYSDLDSLGRCSKAYAVVCKDIMPAEGETRGEIGMVKPSGWQTAKYDKSIISDMYLYNRCHLIGWQLGAENANEKNLITGTRFMNVTGMLKYENVIADYIDENPDNHVLFEVTPVFGGDDLVAYGVIMSALSCEDYGQGVSFCVFCPNVQPGIYINYSNGDNYEDPSVEVQYRANIGQPVNKYADTEDTDDSVSDSTLELSDPVLHYDFVLNTNSMKYHAPGCSAIDSMSEHNKDYYHGIAEDLDAQGYTPCQICLAA